MLTKVRFTLIPVRSPLLNLPLAPLFALALAACSNAAASEPVLRAAGERTPLTSPCGGTDEPRCLLPWPSSAFLGADPTTATGVRVTVENSALPRPDDPTAINNADGLATAASSRSPTGFTANVDPNTIVDGVVRLFDDQPGKNFGDESLLGLRLVNGVNSGVPEAILIITPKRPLAAASEFLAVVMDSIHAQDGSAFPQSRTTQVALGLTAPNGSDEETVYSHYAPARAMLAGKNIDPAHVLRLWDFTTRSTLDPTRRLQAMRAITTAAATSGSIGVAIDSTGGSDSSIATIVIGRLTNVPDFLTDEDQTGHLVYDLERRTGSAERARRQLSRRAPARDPRLPGGDLRARHGRKLSR